MKLLKFFIKNIILKKPIFILSMVTLFLIVNFISFTAIRFMISTYQGYQEMKIINKDGTLIANLDPNSETDFDKIKKEDTQKIYNYLNQNFNYAFQVDGFITNLYNSSNMEITLSYINDNAYKDNQYKINQGQSINDNYKLKKEEIPVLIGYGLLKDYPIGSKIKIKDAAISEPLNLVVAGVLNKNVYRSNFYALNLKNYFNFSIFIPVNHVFLTNSKLDLQINGLMDMILLNTTKEKSQELSQYIKKNTGLEVNFFSQKENFKSFKDYYANSFKIIFIIAVSLSMLLILVVIWNNLWSVRFMMTEFTIHLLVDLSYFKLRKIFYSYFGALIVINTIILWIFAAYNRYLPWLNKAPLLVTYRVLGLINVDWLALLCVILIDSAIVFFAVEISLRKIKKKWLSCFLN